MILAYAAIFLAAFLLTVALVPVARAASRRAGLVDVPGGRKAHASPTPLGGGLAVAAASGLTLAGALLAAWADQRGFVRLPVPAGVRVLLPGVLDQGPRLLLVLGGGAAILGMGLLDDLRDLGPRSKLLGQLAIAGALVAFGDIRLSLFTEGEGPFGYAISVAATLLWIAAVTNAFNLLDHMDGICAGVAAVSGLAFLAVALQTGQLFIAGLLVVGVAACAGFLVYNFHPASVFLGDAGSQLIGYGLGVTTVLFTFYRASYPAFSYFVPAIVLAVPLYDMLRVVGIRLAEGRSPFQGDRNHLSHRLLGLGFSVRQAAGVVYLLTGATGLAAVLLYHVEAAPSVLVIALVVVLLILVGILDSRGRRGEGSQGPGCGTGD
jgi:UDP-GlcNAc:undecaprenyl-phosphate GlcNAc-1-phosphate transferase